jgi:hypothetical protein
MDTILLLIGHWVVPYHFYDLRIGVAVVGLEAEAVDLPEDHTKRPHIRL